MWHKLRLFSLLLLAFVMATSVVWAQDKGTIVIKNGAFPWSDRSTPPNTWALQDVPESLNGTGPLPQQNCGSRSLDIPGKPQSVTIGVSEKDIEAFKAQYPAAQATGQNIAVVNPRGDRIGYQIFTLANPAEKIGKGQFHAGLLLLKVEGGDAAMPATKAANTLAPVTAVAPQNGMPAPQLVAPVAAPAANPQPVPASLPTKENLHIYLLMGQSNMVGRDTSTLVAQVDNPRVISLRTEGNWVVAHEPMYAGGTGIGPGISFATEMLKRDPNATIGLVPCAVGGTPLSRWVKGGDLYQKAVARAKIAAPAGIISGVLWHQGETDTAKQELADTYETRLTGMFKDLRLDLGQPNLPIVVGQIGEFLTPDKYPFVEKVRGAIAHVPADLPLVGYAPSTALGDKGDKLHFSAAAQREFGIRYSIVMQTLQTAMLTKP